MRRVGFILLSLIFVLNPVLAFATDEATVVIVLHKLMYVDPSASPDYKINSGLIESVDDDTYGFNGVEFTIYDLSDYVAQRKESYETIAQRISNKSLDSLIKLGDTQGHLVEKVVTTTQQGEAGVAKLRVNGDLNKAYLILETNTPKIEGLYEVNHNAVPMLVVLPVEHPTIKDTMLSTIHLYPKNFGYVPDVLPEVPYPGIHPPTGISRSSCIPAYGILGVGLLILFLNKGKSFQGESNENK